MKDCIPELSEVRMARRAPAQPMRFEATDALYLQNCLRCVERAFALDTFPGRPYRDTYSALLEEQTRR
jgi:hypothetical protein